MDEQNTPAPAAAAPAPAPVSTADVDFLAWLEVNKGRLLVGLAIVGVAAFGYSASRHMSARREVKAAEALSLLRLPMGPNTKEAATPAQFFDLAKEYSGTTAAPRAALLGAQALYNSGKYAEARAAFEKYLAGHPGHTYAAQAALGIAASFDAEGKTADATKRYEEIIARHSTEPHITGQSRIALGRLHEAAGRLDTAYKLYMELLSPQGQGAWSDEAAQRRFDLERRQPELALLSAPPKPLTPPTLTATNQPRLQTNITVQMGTNKVTATNKMPNLNLLTAQASNAVKTIVTNAVKAVTNTLPVKTP